MITTTIRTLTLNHPFSLPLSLPLLYRISTLTTMNDFGVLRKRFGRYEEVTLISVCCASVLVAMRR